jgi:phospholipase C
VLGKSLFFSVLTLAKGKGLTVPDLDPIAPVKGGEALAIAREIVGEIFPNMRD